MFFECHFFDVAIDPNTQTQMWTVAGVCIGGASWGAPCGQAMLGRTAGIVGLGGIAAAHLSFDGTARWVKGKWLFSTALAQVSAVPVP